MSSLAEGRSMAPLSLHVKCPCGRELRARPEQAGLQITCWSCHATVPVPVPVAPSGWVARLLRMAARQILDARIITLLSIGAFLVTLALSLTSLEAPLGARLRAWSPHLGVWAAAAALGLVMVGFGELLRRGSHGDWAPRPVVGPLAMVWRTLICLGAGTALVLPLIIAAEGQTPPRLTPAGLAVTLAAILILPLVMLATYLPRGSIRDRAKVVGSMLKRHPMAVLMSLLLLPLSLPAIEAALILLTRLTLTFSFLLLDLFPPRDVIRGYSSASPITCARATCPRPGSTCAIASDSLVFGLYGDSMRSGYTLLGAIPASLAMGTVNGYNSNHTIGAGPGGYLIYRMLFTLVIVTCMLCVLAVQARWLGLLSTLDSRRSAAVS